MKLIHTADLHLDAPAEAHLSPEQSKERRNELLLSFRRLVQYAAEENVSAILIAGDLFDRKTVSKTASNVVLHAIEEHPDITFFYVSGNHDEQGFSDRAEGLPDNLKTFTGAFSTYEFGPLLTVTGIELSKASPGVYETLSLPPDKLNIVMMHGQESDSGSKNDAEIIRMRSLKNRNIDYLALGHVHQFKKAELDSRGVYVYPGCLEGRGFDECGVKGFVLIDVDEEEKTIDSVFVPFALRTLYDIPVDLAELKTTGRIIEAVEEEIRSKRISPDSLVKVTLTGEYDVDDERDVSLIEKAFEGRFYAFYVKDTARARIDYRKYALDLSLKGEFVRTVEQADLPEETKAKIIEAGIRALKGEELFS